MHIIVSLGAALNLAGSVMYARDTWMGKSKPNIVTFILWAAAPLIATAAMIANGAGWAALPVFATGFGPLLILASAFFSRHSTWQSGPFDYVCGLFSALALILWACTQNAIIAIIFSILSDGLAALPALKKAWTHPETETPFAYVAAWFCALSTFTEARDSSFGQIGFAVYLLIILTAFLVALYRKKIATCLTRAH
jgi:hypothetical protein